MEVERHVGSTRLHDSHWIEQHQLATVYHDTHSHLWLHVVLLLQQDSQTVGHGVYLTECKVLVLEYNTRVVGCFPSLLRKQVYQGLRGVVAKRLAQSQLRKSNAVLVSQRWQRAYICIWLFSHILQHLSHHAHDLLNFTLAVLHWVELQVHSQFVISVSKGR